MRFLRDARGTAMIEFGFALPLLLVLFYGAVELTRYILFNEKMESASLQVLDIINQENELSMSDLNNVFSSIPLIMAPFRNHDVAPRVTVVERTRDPGGRRCQLRVLWSLGPGISRINPEADNRLPEITVEAGDTVTIIEMVGRYRPLLDDAMQRNVVGNLTNEVYFRSYARPRYGAFRCNPATRVCRSTPC